MSLSICAITGQSLVEPVVSKKSGHLFQKAVIIKHLSSFPYCPITNTPLNFEDLIDVVPFRQQVNRPQESANNFLNNLKNQYDTLVLEQFYIKKSIKQTKEELAHSLASNQAAHRIIAKLLKEKQQAQKQLQVMQKQLSQLKK